MKAFFSMQRLLAGLAMCCLFLSPKVQAQAMVWTDVSDSIDGPIQMMVPYNGELFIGGNFFNIGSNFTRFLAMWDGTNFSFWNNSSLSGFGFDDMIEYNGKAYLAGAYSILFGPVNMAEWDGSDLVGTALNVNNNAQTLHTDGTSLFVGGGLPEGIQRWDGAAYQSMAGGVNGDVHKIVGFNGNVIAGGNFTMAGGNAVASIASWNGTAWAALGDGLNGSVADMIVYQGDLYVCGDFTHPTIGAIEDVARWDGSSWSAVGSSITTGLNELLTMAENNGMLYVGGDISEADGNTVYNVARWDGSNWSAAGDSLPATVVKLGTFNGSLLCGMLSGPSSPLPMKRLGPATAHAPLLSDVVLETSLSPNPTHERLTLQLDARGRTPGDLRISILTARGQRISTRAGHEGMNELDVSGLAAGLYFAEIQTKNGYRKAIPFVKH